MEIFSMISWTPGTEFLFSDMPVSVASLPKLLTSIHLTPEKTLNEFG